MGAPLYNTALSEMMACDETTERLGAARVALVHDWLVAGRGGEQVLEALAVLLPRADVYTLVMDPRHVPARLRGRRIRTSWLQHVLGRRRFRLALPLFPWTIEQFRLADYDLVISVSHTVAKGIRASGAPHLCYCLTPMRYVWVCPDLYWGSAARARWAPQRHLVRYLQRWDVAACDRVDAFAAISETVRRRIRQSYQRDAEVIYPPVDCDRFARVTRHPGDYYLVVAALVPYKRTDLAIEVFNRLRQPLVVIGTGPEEARLRRLAGSTIQFVGWQTPERLAEWYAGAKALIYPQEEDFGLAAVEAQAAGCPVIALRRGGATETVAEGITGAFFDEQTGDAVADAVTRFERTPTDPQPIRDHARRFDRREFVRAFSQWIADMLVNGHRP